MNYNTFQNAYAFAKLIQAIRINNQTIEPLYNYHRSLEEIAAHAAANITKQTKRRPISNEV